jgi:crotonobetainyl-CoA:carnitine CoA-transferase CaiB-like acyl-CoA transferase
MIPHIDFEPNASAPLDGIRVVDLSRLVAGNMVSLQLADQGAEVVKIEDPRVGDPLRAWRVKGLSLHWKVYARNKKSLAINLRPQAGRDALMELIARSQVLIENYRPGTLEEMGFGPDVLHARNPGLIIVRIAIDRASARWSKGCRASRPRTVMPIGHRCCRRWRWPT